MESECSNFLDSQGFPFWVDPYLVKLNVRTLHGLYQLPDAKATELGIVWSPILPGLLLHQLFEASVSEDGPAAKKRKKNMEDALITVEVLEDCVNQHITDVCFQGQSSELARLVLSYICTKPFHNHSPSGPIRVVQYTGSHHTPVSGWLTPTRQALRAPYRNNTRDCLLESVSTSPWNFERNILYLDPTTVEFLEWAFKQRQTEQPKLELFMILVCPSKDCHNKITTRHLNGRRNPSHLTGCCCGIYLGECLGPVFVCTQPLRIMIYMDPRKDGGTWNNLYIDEIVSSSLQSWSSRPNFSNQRFESV